MRKRKLKQLSPTEFCKRHNVDHTGTWCGHCVEKWKKDSNKLRTIREHWKSKGFGRLHPVLIKTLGSPKAS